MHWKCLWSQSAAQAHPPLALAQYVHHTYPAFIYYIMVRPQSVMLWQALLFSAPFQVALITRYAMYNTFSS